MACEVCGGRGFLLLKRDLVYLEIQRCDSCQKYKDDEEATAACYNLALKAGKHEATEPPEPGSLHCPDCGSQTLRLIENTEPAELDGEYKEVRTCDGCENIVYIVRGT